jgi:hypothetical protein
MIAVISVWGEGAAFLAIYAGLLALTAVLVLVLQGVAWLRGRLAAEQRGVAQAAPDSRPESILPWRATRWVLRGLLVLLCGAALSGLVVGVVAHFSEPIGGFPGGKLSGEVASGPAADWSFLDEFEMIQVEVSPDDPRSVNVYSFVHEGELYVGADFYYPFKRWVHEAMRDDRITIRAREKLYPMRAVRITDAGEVAALRSELERRLAIWQGRDPETAFGFLTDVWFFRMDPR